MISLRCRHRTADTAIFDCCDHTRSLQSHRNRRDHAVIFHCDSCNVTATAAATAISPRSLRPPLIAISLRPPRSLQSHCNRCDHCDPCDPTGITAVAVVRGRGDRSEVAVVAVIAVIVVVAAITDRCDHCDLCGRTASTTSSFTAIAVISDRCSRCDHCDHCDLCPLRSLRSLRFHCELARRGRCVRCGLWLKQSLRHHGKLCDVAAVTAISAISRRSLQSLIAAISRDHCNRTAITL